MSYSIKLITVSTSNSWAMGDNYEISLVLKDNVFYLRGKRVRIAEMLAKPETTRKTVKVSKECGNGIQNELRSANIPLMPQDAAGCDGTFYLMIVGSCFGGATYNWWSQPPTGWEIVGGYSLSCREIHFVLVICFIQQYIICAIACKPCLLEGAITI